MLMGIKSSKSEKNKSIQLDDLITYVCGITYHMLMADVYGRCNNYIEHCEWQFTYNTDFTKNHTLALIINVKYPLNNLTIQGEDKDECVVCNENTRELIVCCKQPVCKKCLKKIQKHNPDNFCCPMCRKNLDIHTTKFILTKEEVKARCPIESM